MKKIILKPTFKVKIDFETKEDRLIKVLPFLYCIVNMI